MGTSNELLEACRRGDREKVEDILEKGFKRKSVIEMIFRTGIKDITDEFGNSPLHVAAQYGHKEVLDAFKNHGYNLSLRNKNTGATALHLAAIHGHADIIDWAVDNGLNLDAPDTFYRTPLHWAAQRNHAKVVRSLVEKGANVNLTVSGKTAFDLSSDPRIKAYLFAEMDPTHRRSMTPFDMHARPGGETFERHATMISPPQFTDDRSRRTMTA